MEGTPKGRVRQWISVGPIALFFLCAISFAGSLGSSPDQNRTGRPLSQEPTRILYQIYVQSFLDSAADGEGDFDGVTQKLDYLKSLGVGGLLLMPIFESDDGMGYIPRDFYKLRNIYAGEGSSSQREEKFKKLLNAAHERGIKIFLDVPINHISKNSTWFQNSVRRVPGFEDFFLWSDYPRQGWKIPWEESSRPEDVWFSDQTRRQYYYALFGWGMPEFNHRNSEVVRTMEGIFDHYAAMGVDGFRIDAAKHLNEGITNTESFVPENISLLRHYLSKVREQYPNQSFMLEVWSGYDEIEAFPADSGDVKFDFPYMGALRDSLKYSHPYGVRNVLAHMAQTQDQFPPGQRIVFAGNHDVPRLRTHVGGDQPRAELGFALTFALPFSPMIYYGDEIYMSGDYIRYPKKPENNKNDVCMPMLWTPGANAGYTASSVSLPSGSAGWNKKIQDDWQRYNVETESADPHSFLNMIRKMTEVRQSLPWTTRTRFFVDKVSDSDPVLRIAMTFEDGRCVVGIFNFSESRQNFRSIAMPGACGQSPFTPRLQKRVFQRQADSLDMDPYGYAIFESFGR